MTQRQPPACPECERLSEVANESNKIGDFIDWLKDKGIVFAEWGDDEVLYSTYLNINKVLAEYYGIDLDKVETERRALLDWIREQNQ